MSEACSSRAAAGKAEIAAPEMAEMHARCRRDAGEMQGRYSEIFLSGAAISTVSRPYPYP